MCRLCFLTQTHDGRTIEELILGKNKITELTCTIETLKEFLEGNIGSNKGQGEVSFSTCSLHAPFCVIRKYDQFDQLVSDPTCENNMFDLVIVSYNPLINNVAVGKHLGSCDHKIVGVDINTMISLIENKTLVLNKKRGNFENLR